MKQHPTVSIKRILECFPLCQRFRKVRWEVKWKSPFPAVSSDRNIRDRFWRWYNFVWNIQTEIRRSIFDKTVFALIGEFGKGIKHGYRNSHSYWFARFNRKLSLHFPWVFPLISERSVWHNRRHP